MINFEKELSSLISCENRLLESDEFKLLADEGKRIVAAIDRKQTDASLQIEEIYDIVNGANQIEEELRTERGKVGELRDTAVFLADMIDDLLHYAQQTEDFGLIKQAQMMRKNTTIAMEKRGFLRFGEIGEPLDPELHIVHLMEQSDIPHEHISNVIQCGYCFIGALIRKATVIISKNEVKQYE